MKIEISTKEYQGLLDILHLADAVMSGHRSEEDPRTERHRAVIQKLYGVAAAEGLDRLISYNESAKGYAPTAEFEEHTLSHTVIDEYRDHLFWDELITRLSVRDAALTAGGVEHLTAMKDSDRQQLERPIRQRYIEEFSLYGIEHLEVIERFGIGERTVTTSD